ncbi:MAG TPA: hypothetical protein VLN74_10340 [Ilumatobacteraceae bacterium]|nr:hypothetical protein [Ilumatobacteraceae bacterium]
MDMQRAAIRAGNMEFSPTYDAYGVHRSLERISIAAHRAWTARSAGSLGDCALDDLRAALFMTQRGWHRDGNGNGNGNGLESDVDVEWELVAAINEAAGRLVHDGHPSPL